MKTADFDPVGAFVSGITSTLVRCAVAWFMLGLGLGIPLIPLVGWPQAGFAVVFWPLAMMYGIGEWGSLSGPAPLAVLVIPAGIFVAAWAFITSRWPAGSLWMLFSFSLLLTGPALLKTDWLGIVPGLWVLGTAVFWAIRFRMGRCPSPVD